MVVIVRILLVRIAVEFPVLVTVVRLPGDRREVQVLDMIMSRGIVLVIVLVLVRVRM